MRNNKRIHDFKGFVNEMANAGYGEEPFFFAKDGEQCNYLFKIDVDNNSHRGFIISLGKFSQFTQPTDPKTDYAVISITEVDEDVLDQSVTDKGKFEPNERRVDVDDKSLSKIMSILSQIVEDYLQKNAKVNKFYDEMQDKIKSDLYEGAMKNSIAEWPGDWSFQQIEKGKLNMISK